MTEPTKKPDEHPDAPDVSEAPTKPQTWMQGIGNAILELALWEQICIPYIQPEHVTSLINSQIATNHYDYLTIQKIIQGINIQNSEDAKLSLRMETLPDSQKTKPAEPPKPEAPPEVTFDILLYQKRYGKQLKEIEVSSKPNTNPETWTYAYNILQQQNATIKNRYHPEGYKHSYWLFNGKIYRQLLQKDTNNDKPTKKEED